MHILYSRCPPVFRKCSPSPWLLSSGRSPLSGPGDCSWYRHIHQLFWLSEPHANTFVMFKSMAWCLEKYIYASVTYSDLRPDQITTNLSEPIIVVSRWLPVVLWGETTPESYSHLSTLLGKNWKFCPLALTAWILNTSSYTIIAILLSSTWTKVIVRCEGPIISWSLGNDYCIIQLQNEM